MVRVMISFLILGIAILSVSAGLLILTEAQIDKRPANPVHFSLIAEKRNLAQAKQVSQVGIMVGAGIVTLSATAMGVHNWRDRLKPVRTPSDKP